MTSLVRLFFVCSCLVSLSATAEIYSWTDEDGNKHFSDEPPEEGAREVRKEEIELHNIDSSYPAGIVSNPDRKKDDREQSEREAKVAARKREQCKEARERLKKLAGPVIFRDGDGNVVYKSEKERAEIEQEFRAKVERHCGERR